jgi:hypothetical protein
MTFRPELIDELLKDYRNPEELMGESGIFKQLSKALIERCLSAEGPVSKRTCRLIIPQIHSYI